MTEHAIEHAHTTGAVQQAPMRTYRPTDEVDFVIVGSGAAGGVMARELARNGFSVVVLEQGPWLTERDFGTTISGSSRAPKRP
jgi:ribulose 1,5-bisphosphate synthetase/thiazole synthase